MSGKCFILESHSSVILPLFIDRGILMTFGSGVHGSLGHGNHNDVVQAKIVEALIGFEVEQVS